MKIILKDNKLIIDGENMVVKPEKYPWLVIDAPAEIEIIYGGFIFTNNDDGFVNIDINYSERK